MADPTLSNGRDRTFHMAEPLISINRYECWRPLPALR